MNNLFEGDIIEEFSGDYRFLSNFWPCEIKYKGFVFPSTEHAYQAVKWLYVSNNDHPEELIFDFLEKATTAGKAKRMGRMIPIDPKIWGGVKVQVMREVSHIKYIDALDLRELLKATNPMYIQEGNNWGDTFWGVDLKTGLGKNVLGRILMNERLFIV